MSQTLGAPLADADGGDAGSDAVEGRAARFSSLISGVWLLFLLPPALRHLDELAEPRVWMSYVALALFLTAYVALFEMVRRRREALDLELPAREAWLLIGLLLVSGATILFGWGQDGAGVGIFASVCAAMALPTLHAAVLVGALAGGLLTVSVLEPSWESDVFIPLAVVAAGLLMWGIRQVMGRNAELMQMRAENERLLLAQERSRFARDLHDILGHSLTVIAVKAELAHRLLSVEPGRAEQELMDLERLSREALADVREAVEGYRTITLPGEIARARIALDAAGIRAALPSSADDVAGPLRELFAWAIREGVTNVVRHSTATQCTVDLTAALVRVCNDGHQPGPVVEGHGLRGLRERAEAVGARVTVQSTRPGEFVLEVRGTSA